MRKGKKALAVCILLFSMVFTNLTVFAATPRAVTCPKCDSGGLVKVVAGYTSWEVKSSKPCEHGHLFTLDSYETRFKVYQWKCTNSRCDYAEGADSVFEDRWECQWGIWGPQP